MAKARIFLWLLVAAAAGLLAAQVALRTIEADRREAVTPREAHEVAREMITGEFKLVDHDGRAVTQADYRGSWLLVFFGYTHCPDVCPTTLGTVALALEALGPAADNLRPLFVTVDPARDTPAVMADYVAAFGPRFVGLSGTAEQVEAAAKSFRVYYAKVPLEDGDYAMDHTAYIFLIGPDGEWDAVLTPTDSPEKIAAEIRRRIAAS